MNASFCLRLFLLSVIAAVTLPAISHAKDLSGHFGIGFNQPLDSVPPAIDVKFVVTEAFAVGGGLSLDTEDNNNKLALGMKLYRNAFSEENSHFFLGLGLYFVSIQTSGSTHSGAMLTGFIGDEFFFQGLPRLGFSFEAGVKLDTTGSLKFSTTAQSFVNAGLHYYF
jgi:hypothetical protein